MLDSLVSVPVRFQDEMKVSSQSVTHQSLMGVKLEVSTRVARDRARPGRPPTTGCKNGKWLAIKKNSIVEWRKSHVANIRGKHEKERS